MLDDDSNPKAQLSEMGDFLSFMKNDVSLYEGFSQYEMTSHLQNEVKRLSDESKEIKKLNDCLSAENSFLRSEFQKLVSEINSLKNQVSELKKK